MSRNFVSMFLLAVMPYLLSTGVQAQQPSIHVSRLISEEVRNDDAAAHRLDITLRRKHYPYVIFIPGILGSELSVKNPNSGKEKKIWGRSKNLLKSDDLFFDPSDDQNVSAKVLDKIDAGIFTEQIYGNALLYIKNRQYSDVKTLNFFAYDWRQDNRESAADLNKWLCTRFDELGHRKIIFIAHSMGGLLLKEWLRAHHKDNWCDDDKPPLRIDKVLFLGTPHFGSPKSIRAFGQGFMLKAKPEALFGSIFGAVDRRTLSRSLNNAGASFPSVYQLLPIYKKRECIGHHPFLEDLPDPIIVEDESPTSDVELFDVATWRRLKWPKQLPSQWNNRDYYYSAILPDVLRRAHSFLCRLSGYRIEDNHKNIKVVYFVGASEEEDTEASYLIRIKKDRYGKTRTRFNINPSGGYTKGDGTVPELVAGDLWRAEPDLVRRFSKEHDELLSAKEFKKYVEGIFAHARSLYERELFQSRFQKAFLDAYVRVKALAMVPLSLKLAESVKFDVNRSMNDEIGKRIGISASDIYRIAKFTDDAGRRAEFYAIAYSSKRLPLIEKAWAANNLSSLEFGLANYKAAAEAAEKSRHIAIELAGEHRPIKVIGTATNTEAWSRLNLGDSERAKHLFEIAGRLGNPKAKVGLRLIEASRPTIQ